MMHFQKNRKLQCKEVTRFTGADFSLPEGTHSLDAASDMANVYIDELGRICKRTGYRKLMQSDAAVNGLFCYEYRTENEARKQYFIHIGTRLYLCDVTKDRVVPGECIAEGFADVKSRSFVFGGAMYIMGAGYYKIMWDAHYEMLVCGFVGKTETDTENTSVLLSGCEANVWPLAGTKRQVMRAQCLYKEIRYALRRYNFQGNEKLYIAPPALVNEVHVEQVSYEKEDGSVTTLSPVQYKVLSDTKGLYVLLDRVTLSVDENISCMPRVRFSYNNFVYVPTNVLGRTPTVVKSFYDAQLAGEEHYDGTLLEAYNLCAPHRAAEFNITATNRTGGNGLRFCLEPKKCSGRVLRIWIDGALVQSYMRFTGSGAEPTVWPEDCTYVDVLNTLLPEGDCNVRVEYIKEPSAADSAMAYAMDTCSVFGLFGGKNNTRVFLSGNPKLPGYDFASGLYDASYFPDTGYTVVGSDGSAIVGYHKISGYQVILKDGRNFDSTQYLRTYTLSEDGQAVFTIRQGVQGVAARGASTFKNYRDRMLFAGADGVYEIRSSDVEAQTNLKYLSDAVRARIAREHMETAVCAVWENRYYLAADSVMYVLDLQNGIQWYLYTDLPQVRCLYTEGDTMYFGASDGGVYRFMSPDEPEAYYDNVGIGNDKSAARAIRAYWDVPVTTLGSGLQRKSIEDVCIYLAPQPKSSLCVYYTTEYAKEGYRHSEIARRFDFSDLDFGGIAFDASDYPLCINTRAKAKRVRVFGVRLENAEPGEGMCISGIAIRYMHNKTIR